MNATESPRLVQGFSLLELMVALLIGTLLVAAVVSTFLVSRAGYSLREGRDSIQDNGRAALQLMSEDIRLAGWWGINTQAQRISPGETAKMDYGCGVGWASDITQAVYVYNQDNSAARPECISDADYLERTDILVIRHAGQKLDSEIDIRQGSVYLHTGLSNGLLFEAEADGRVDRNALLTQAAPRYIYPLETHMYFVRPWSQTRGDQIPTLVQAVLDGNEITVDPLVEFVENLQVTLGRDTNGDGSVDTYSTPDTAMPASRWAQVRSVLVEALVRAPNIEPGHTGQSLYTLGDVELDVSDEPFRRQLFSATVNIRNQVPEPLASNQHVAGGEVP